MNLNSFKFKELFIPDYYLDPDRAGVKHVIFSFDWDRPLITALIDNKSQCVKIWNGSTDVLMEILEGWASAEHLKWFHVSEHDCAQGLVNWCEDAKRPLDVNKLFCFELYHDDQGGSQQLCLAPEHGSWLVVFSRRMNFEIAFYGADSDWDRLKDYFDTRTGETGCGCDNDRLRIVPCDLSCLPKVAP